MPKVSVIVPNYNHAPYLKQRLDSIFNQTFQDFEVIILDDCSTDNSKEIIEQYRNNPKVSHIVYNETNSGTPFKQWAKGFDLAQGEYIWIAESDDWSELNFIKALLENLKNKENVSLAFVNSIWEYEKSQKTNTLSDTNFFVSGIQFIRNKMSYNNFICNASSVLIKRECIFKISREYQDYKSSGDYLFWILLSYCGNVFYLNKPLNHYRQHTTSTTTQSKKNGGQYRENHRIFSYLRNRKEISFFTKQKIILYYLNLINEDFKKEIISKNTFQECSNLWKKDFCFPLASIFFQKIKKLVDSFKMR